jgi:general secretion pathway protein K
LSAFPYRAANRAIASVSELRAVDGITPELYKRIAPFLSVWPDDGSKINILTAPAEVLAALNEDDSLEPLSQQQVAQIIELRTNGMLVDVDSFLESPLFSEDSTADLRAMVDVKSSWFLLDSRVDIADRERRLYSVLHRQGRAISIVHRTEGEL